MWWGRWWSFLKRALRNIRGGGGERFQRGVEDFSGGVEIFYVRGKIFSGGLGFFREG